MNQNVAIYLLWKNRILCHKRGNLRHGKYKVSAPGGAIDKGETSLQAVIRETWEETGFKIKDIDKLVLFSTQSNVDAYYYICDKKPTISGPDNDWELDKDWKPMVGIDAGGYHWWLSYKEIIEMKNFWKISMFYVEQLAKIFNQ